MGTLSTSDDTTPERDINILIVDDLPENLRLLSNILKKNGYLVRPALNGNAALNAVLHTPADLVLLDMRMPEMDGIEVCRQLKQNESTRNIPVIFISAADDANKKVAGFQAGGVDYITKPFQPDEVLARIGVQLELRRAQKELEQAYQNMEQKVQERTAELTAAYEALRESEEKFRTLNENLPLGVFRTTVSGRLLSANQAMLNIFGYDTFFEQWDERVAHQIYRNINDREHLYRLLKKNGKLNGYEVSMKRRDGTEFPAAFSARIVIDPKTGEEYIDGVLEDISERKKIEERNKSLEKQIRQAQKMEAVGTLAGGIAHDFNNILSAVLGFTELAKLDHAQGIDIGNALDEIHAAGIRARELVKQILTFSRHDDIQRAPVIITPLVKEALRFLKSSLPTTIEIRQHIDDIDETILADPTQIQQIVMNLCTNAAHAMNGKGTLDVRLTKVVLDDQSMPDYKALSPGNYLRLAVSDTGQGINPGIIHRIFEPFFTTKKIGEGTGMGLSVVHGIVKNMEGEITVYSEVGKGTAFNVLLPVHEETQKQAVEKETEAVPHGSGNILMVDDEDMIIQAASAILLSLGYEVEARTSSKDALVRFKAAPDRFDLVLTDLTMPEMTGVALAMEIRKISPDIPIVLCTGFTAGITEQTRVMSGIDKILMKPILRSELARTLNDLLGDSRGKTSRAPFDSASAGSSLKAP